MAEPEIVMTPQRLVRATRVEIDLGAIAHNISSIRKKIGPRRELMAVVKADGYGHGAVEVSRTALRSGATWLGVAIPEEGALLRQAGIAAPIFVLGPIQAEEADKSVAYRLHQAVCSMELAEALDREAGRLSTVARVHVKVDTGMGRVGLEPGEVLPFVRRLSGLNHLRIAGVFSHLSSADERDKAFTAYQLDVFRRVIKDMKAAKVPVPLKHVANSAGVLDHPESYFDMVRPGIMIYGLYPSPEVGRSINLKTAMTFKTRVSMVKEVQPGTPISYGRTFVADRRMVVATLPVGYADGYNRLLSNRGVVFIAGKRAPVIGRVCMDMIMVDVTEIADVSIGEEVILFGQDLHVDEIAEAVGTINYEVVCAVGKRVPRIYLPHDNKT